MRVVKPAVYILASKRNGTLYIGVTGYLAARVSIHLQDLEDSFTKRYGVRMLVHYEHFDTMLDAIAREKQLKKFRRAAKLELIRKQQSAMARFDFGGAGLAKLTPAVTTNEKSMSAFT